MVESNYITPKWTYLTSQNKAVLHLQAPPWNTFWIADKYLSCRPFHGKYSLQINYSGFLKLKQRAVSTVTFRMRGKRGDLWEGLHTCRWKISLLDSSINRGRLWLSQPQTVSQHRSIQSHPSLEHELRYKSTARAFQILILQPAPNELTPLWLKADQEALHRIYLSVTTHSPDLFQEAKNVSFHQCNSSVQQK